MMDEFDFDASTDQAWSLFADRLGDVVSLVEDEEPLTLSTLGISVEPIPAVRFSASPRVDRETSAQVVAEVLDPIALTPEHLEQLDELGWHLPDDEHTLPWIRHVQDDCSWIANQAVSVLREVLGVQHPVFLAPDQLAEVLQPAASEDHAVAVGEPTGGACVMPTSKEHLEQLVEAELRAVFGAPPVRDSSGDFAIRVGSAMVFVRVTPDLREVVLFSSLVHDVEGRSRATEVLNDLNMDSRFGRFSIHRDRVYVSMGLLARPFVPEHLRQGVQILTQIADAIDDELAAKLRGRTTFSDQ